ncbi:MAG: hypothetical protein O6924_07310 [Alphaproteobacteria bacterium]|nr:hypothetical protein [Alphaproteobacteria bacterium]
MSRMTKLHKNTVHVPDVPHQIIQGTRGPQAPGGPGTDRRGARHTYIVGDVSVIRSTKITFKAAENISQAVGYAAEIGFPLQYNLTIDWPDDSKHYHDQILRELAKWQRYNMGKAVFVWCREAKNGPHSHILLSCPPKMKPRLDKLVVKWLKRILNCRSLPTRAKWFRSIHKTGDPAEHIDKRVKYILKGADADTRLHFGIDKEELTYIRGKRTGMSQALNVSARRRAGAAVPSGLRRPTKEMLGAARERDRLEAERKASGSFTSPYSSTVTPASSPGREGLPTAIRHDAGANGPGHRGIGGPNWPALSKAVSG